MDAMDHLGKVLYILSELSPSHRCKALNDALEFYNSANPTARVEPCGCGITYLVHASFADDRPAIVHAGGEISYQDAL